jgi:hypothetical protein
MPKVKDIKPHISSFLEDFKSTNGVKSLYVWGSYSDHIDNPNYRVRDIDVLAKTSFHSGDLIAIDNKIVKDICTSSYLEAQGYDPLSVDFSKKFLKLAKYIDCWAISSDRKLLHWGPIFVNKQESQEMNEEAEKYAKKITGKERTHINKSSETARKNWYNNYYHFLEQQFESMPTGWYKTENIKVREITSKAIKI